MSSKTPVHLFFLLVFSFPVSAVDADKDSLPDAWELANARDPAVPDYLVDAGWNTSCGLDDGGTSCWGTTGAGQGSVPGLTDLQQIAAGAGHVCALDSTGVVCWGSATSGKTTPPAMTGVIKISSLLHHTCAVHDGGVDCWGVNTNGQNDVPPQLNSPSDVAAGSNHSCALGSNGVFCWGLNTSGQTDVPSLTNPVAVAAGGSHSCAIDDTGVVCWGGNGQGQLNVPVLDTPVAIDAGSGQTCVIDAVLGVVCWGQDNYSQSSGVPVMVNPVTVSTGQQHNCALADGGIYCWGRDVEGQSDASALVIDPDGDGIESDVDACPLLDNAVTDTDGDCIGDVDDPDDDNDGLTDIEEAGLGTDPLSEDTDLDAITDYDEVNVWGTNPLVADQDFDADGIPDAADADDDNDTWPDVEDPFPFDQTKPIIALQDPGRYVFHGNWGEIGTVGIAVSVAGDINNDGYDDIIFSSSSTAPTKGQVNVYSGVDSQLLYQLVGEFGGDDFGNSIAGDLNLDGDAYADFIVGTWKKEQGATQNVGSVYAYAGVDGSLLWQVYGDAAYGFFGNSVGKVGDVNQDGYDDVVVGAYEDNEVATKAGAAFLVSGVDGSKLHKYLGTASLDRFGVSVDGAGDVNNDGYPDIIVGAYHSDASLYNAGSVYVYSGKDNSLIYQFNGDSVEDYFGAFVSGAGDLDADGYDDFLTAEIPDTNRSVKAFSGKDGVLLQEIGASLPHESSYLYNEDVYRGPQAVGDFNADGYDDFLVWVGGINVYSGKDFSILRSYTTAYRSINSFGRVYGYAGDISGDGKPDILVAAQEDKNNTVLDPSSSNWRGSVFVVSQLKDSDADGMADWFEQATPGLDYLVDDALGDIDSDNATNIDEYYNLGTDLTVADSDADSWLDGDDAFPMDPAEYLDTDGDLIGNNADLDDDGDGMPDDWELANGLDPLVDDSALDPDLDGFSNLDEYLNGTNPNFAEGTQVKNDTDGDHDSDIIWRNRNTGEMAIWSMAGSSRQGTFVVGGLGAAFDLVDTNDLDADGDSDLVLLRQSDGQAIKWEMENHAKVSGSLLVTFPGYTIRKLGDVDADGDPDIIWQDETTGAVILWIMENGVKQSGNFLGSLGAGSKIVAVGDFDTDGDVDLIWSIPGITSLVRWDLENGAKQSGTAIGGFDGYTIERVGDFDADETDDLLWSKDTGGQIILWFMQNGIKQSGSSYSAIPGYKVATVGDYEGDGDDDILWVNDAGHTRMWRFQNGVFYSGYQVGTRDADSDVKP